MWSNAHFIAIFEIICGLVDRVLRPSVGIDSSPLPSLGIEFPPWFGDRVFTFIIITCFIILCFFAYLVTLQLYILLRFALIWWLCLLFFAMLCEIYQMLCSHLYFLCYCCSDLLLQLARPAGSSSVRLCDLLYQLSLGFKIINGNTIFTCLTEI